MKQNSQGHVKEKSEIILNREIEVILANCHFVYTNRTKKIINIYKKFFG